MAPTLSVSYICRSKNRLMPSASDEVSSNVVKDICGERHAYLVDSKCSLELQTRSEVSRPRLHAHDLNSLYNVVCSLMVELK